MRIKQKTSLKTPVRKAGEHVHPKSKRVSELGKKLLAIRQEIEQSGVKLLSYEEVEQELLIRRGGTHLN